LALLARVHELIREQGAVEDISGGAATAAEIQDMLVAQILDDLGVDIAVQIADQLLARVADRALVRLRFNSSRPTAKAPRRSRASWDTVCVVKLDRIARSTRDLFNLLHTFDEQQCCFVSLGEAWCNTETSVGRLLTTVMSGVATFERELIQQRCDEGIARARAKGTKFGRKVKLSPEQRAKAAERYAAGETLAQLGTVYGVSEATMSRALR
jgi:hypothetical protein